MVSFLNISLSPVNKICAAPHLPVHLGSMSTCVRTQAEIWKGKLKSGDVLVSNHPEFGGTHLPGTSILIRLFEYEYGTDSKKISR